MPHVSTVHSRTRTTIRSIVDWWFRDRRTGRIVVAQVPNLAILLWVGTVVARELAAPDTDAHGLLGWVGSGILAWWAVDELVRGVNPWRRLLGLGGCVAVILSVVGRLA